MKEITWQQVYQEWEDREVAIWKEVWEQKGCTSWKQWRAGYIRALCLQQWQWFEEEIHHGEKEFFEDCYASPLTRWRDFADPPSAFMDMEHHPFLVNHSRIKEIQKSLTSKEELTVIVLTDDTVHHDMQCLSSYIRGVYAEPHTYIKDTNGLLEIGSIAKEVLISRFDSGCHFNFLMVDGHHQAMAVATLPDSTHVYTRIHVHVARVPEKFFRALCYRPMMYYERRLWDALYRYNIVRP